MGKNDLKASWQILLEWDKDSQASERLAAMCLEKFGYSNLDPQQPRGGADGGKDIVCQKDGKQYLCCVYFPRGKQVFSKIKSKFLKDSKSTEKNKASGMIFFTNQEITISQREYLKSKLKYECDIIHIEKINDLLNQPTMYGVRLEFLDIEMKKEEQLAFYATQSKIIENLVSHMKTLLDKDTKKYRSPHTVTPQPITNDVYTSFSLNNKIHPCSHCHYGYAITNPVLLYGVNQNLSVTCPKCGNTEQYNRY